MTQNSEVQIVSEKCIGCGACVKVCPREALTIVNGKATKTGKPSFSCGHCEAACPQGAIRVPLLDDEMGRYQTITPKAHWLPFGGFDAAALQQLMASRRSCRNYTDEPVSRAMLEDLVKIGTTAPSGTNSQKWTFTILPTRSAVVHFSGPVKDYFKRLNRMAANPLLRTSLKIFGMGKIAAYYRDHYQSVQRALDEWELEGKDRLFHGATAAIIVGSKPGASCPAEDALLATQNILLAAHCMGLGSCLIGFAVAAMHRDLRIQTVAGISREEKIHAVIGLGHPDETYHKVVRRKKVEPRYFE